VCKLVECICQGVALDGEPFQEEDMPHIRAHVCLSLLEGKIM
jgi:hypothetical protein